MGIVAESLEEFPHVLVHVRVERDIVHELVVLPLVRQLAVPEQPRDLEKCGIFRKLLDRISAIAKNSLVAIDEGDRAATRGCVEKGGIVAHQTRVIRIIGFDFLELDGTDGPFRHRNRVWPGGALILYLERASSLGRSSGRRGQFGGVFLGGGGCGTRTGLRHPVLQLMHQI